MDFSAQMIQQARLRDRFRPRIIFIQGNALAIPFADQQFDAVFNTFSFLHYDSPEQVFQQVSRVLHPGGYFYLVDPTSRYKSELEFRNLTPGGIRFYSPQARERLGEGVGLDCVGHHYLLGLVLLTIFIKPNPTYPEHP